MWESININREIQIIKWGVINICLWKISIVKYNEYQIMLALRIELTKNKREKYGNEVWKKQTWYEK